MVLTVNPTLPSTSASLGTGATPTLVLQPGTVVNAQVQNVLAENLVRIAIANLSIDVMTEVVLTPGQNLQLAVSQTQDGIRLAVIGQGAGQGAASADAASLAPDAPVGATATPSVLPPSDDPLTPLQRIAVSVASEHAAAQQQSLAPLFADLDAVATSNNLPPALRAAVAQVLAQQTKLDPGLTGGDIENAFQTSGLFLEAGLAAGSVPPGGGVPDLKAALIVLRQTLATVLGTTESPAAGSLVSAAASSTLAPSLPDSGGHDILSPQAQLALAADAAAGNPARLMLAEALANGPQTAASAMALNLLQEAMPDIRRAAGLASAATVVSQDGRSEAATVRTNTPPPPFRGALPSAQPVASPSIAPDAPFATVAHRLLDDTDAAIARQTLLQVASLPDRTDASPSRIDALTPRWSFEIPFATPQGTAMAQFEIARDGGGEVAAKKQVWRARFSLDVEPAGPVHALISLSGDRTSVRMWAERPATAAQLRSSAGELSQALIKAELEPGDIVIRDGAPPQPAPAKAGHFLDRAL